MGWGWARGETRGGAVRGRGKWIGWPVIGWPVLEMGWGWPGGVWAMSETETAERQRAQVECEMDE